MRFVKILEIHDPVRFCQGMNKIETGVSSWLRSPLIHGILEDVIF